MGKSILKTLFMLYICFSSISCIIFVKNDIEDFDNFYEKFRIDSTFRKERISIPLRGYNSDEDNLLNSSDSVKIYYWNTFSELEYYLKAVFTDYEENKKNYKVLISKNDHMEVELNKKNSGNSIKFTFVHKHKRWYLEYFFYQNL